MRAGTAAVLGLGSAVLSACVVTPSTKDTGSPDGTPPGTPTGDTGPTDAGADLTCAPDVAPLVVLVCIETTAAQDLDWSPDEAHRDQRVGEGTITEVGGLLPPVSGSAPFYGFAPCGSEHVHQVRLVDANGDTWTFGWDATWTEADDGRFVPGEVGTFAVDLYWSWGGVQSFLIADGDGPRLWIGGEWLFEPGSSGLDLAPWGLTVESDPEAYCEVHDGTNLIRHYATRLSWDRGAAELWSGQSATVPLGARAVEVTVPESMWRVDMMDGGDWDLLTGWETE